LRQDENAHDRCDDSVQGLPTSARQMGPKRGNQLIKSGDQKEHRHQKSRGPSVYYRFAQHQYAGYSEENREQQVQEEPCPLPNHERIDKLDEARKHKQPSKEHHRDHRGCDGSTNRGDAKQQQHDHKREEPSLVMNHLRANSNYHHIDHIRHRRFPFANSGLLLKVGQ